MLAAHIEWILIIAGLATASVLLLFLAPVTMMKLVFGQAPADALSLLIFRHWNLLGCAVGALLIYFTYRPEICVPILTVAIVEKVIFGLSAFSSPLRRRRPVFVMALADSVMPTVFSMYLLGM